MQRLAWAQVDLDQHLQQGSADAQHSTGEPTEEAQARTSPSLGCGMSSCTTLLLDFQSFWEYSRTWKAVC